MEDVACRKSDIPDFLHNEKKTSEQLQIILQRLPAGILVLDSAGVVVQANPVAEELLGPSLCGEKWFDIIGREIVAELDNGCQLQLSRGAIVTIATQSLVKIPGQLVLINDMTQTVRLQKRLEHYQRLSTLGKMAASLAHQIRTPLSTALLYAKHLSSSFENNSMETESRFSKKVVDQLLHIEAQIRDMLIFAKGEQTEFKKISLESLCESVQSIVEERIKSSQSNFKMINNAEKTMLYANLPILVGAIQNCINNAIDAKGDGANILFCAEQSTGNKINLVVMDDGPGIPEELQDKVFEPFFTTRSQGTGLGLAVAKIVAESHGGNLWLSSKNGDGTKIGFCLPSV